MENEKLIAQISQREDSGVDKVAARGSKATSIISRIPKANELRKKVIRLDGVGKSRLNKIRIQENFEVMKETFPFEYGENAVLNIKQNEIQIYSRWLEGETLLDANKKEGSFKPEETARLRNRLRFWARIFEYLFYFHSKGLVHGNIKPQNILIRDKLTVDIKQTYDSEFFDKKGDVPHIILLDGGYSHFVIDNKENIDERVNSAKSIIDNNFWLSPEARGYLEGTYNDSSDLFSLAAIMAWDLGMIQIEKNSVLNALWTLYLAPTSNSFVLGGVWYTWNGKSIVADCLKRLRTILLRILDFVPEKRHSNSRDVAFELMVLANRLSESTDGSKPRENIGNLAFIPIDVDFNEKQVKEILMKSLAIPETISSFLLEKLKPDHNRFWIDARNKTANKYTLMRSVTSGINLLNMNGFYFDAKYTDLPSPFSNLNQFFQNLLSYAFFKNQSILHELRSLFYSLGNQVESVFYVLPALRKYSENKRSYKIMSQNSSIQIRHEALHNSIDRILDKILITSGISLIVLDDLNRSDKSSLSVFLRNLERNSKNIKWIIGIRSEEEFYDEEYKMRIIQLKSKDSTFTSLKDERSGFYWVSKLNSLKPQEARILSSWAISGIHIELEVMEILSSKILSVDGIISSKYHTGKEFDNGINKYEDLIAEELKQSDVLPSTDETEDQKNDPLYLANSVLKSALNLGLISETRDFFTGHIVCYQWAHQFVLLGLSFLLSNKVKKDIYSILFDYLSNNIEEKTTLNEIIQLSEYMMRSDLTRSAYGAYFSLLMASQELCDLNAADLLITKLQILSENMEKERPQDASVLVPKIRENIADLSKVLGRIDDSIKYYEAVSWNVSNTKRKSMLLIKSFFPSQFKNREKRNEEFIKLIKDAENSKLLTGRFDFKTMNLKNMSLKKLNFKNMIDVEIYRIQKRLLEQDTFFDPNESKVTRNSFKNLIKMSSEDNKLDNIYLPRSKPIREVVFSNLLRSCLGWVDNALLLPQVIRILHFAIENNDGESAIHLLFTLLLSVERNISSRTRTLICGTITDLSGRIGSEISIYKVLLYRAWSALFYDGDLLECRKNIDRINLSSIDLPTSLKQCVRKLQLIIEFETLSFDNIQNHTVNIQKYIKKFQQYDLADWSIGQSVFFVQQGYVTLKKQSGDELFLANILSEKIDQTMLYTLYLFEGAQTQAASIVSNEAKEIKTRQWLTDPSSHIDFLPEKMALKIIEYTTIKSSLLDPNKLMPKVNSPLNLMRFLKSSLVDTPEKYWGEDKAIEFNVKMERGSTQDTEKLHFLAQNAIRAGFHWTAFRFAHKARTDLSLILNEIKEIDAIAKKIEEEKTLIEQKEKDVTLSVKQPVAQTIAPMVSYETSRAYPEQGVAINFILEFLHNFQNYIKNANLSEEEIQIISAFIKKSIPVETDLIESTLGGALKAAAKRINWKKSSVEDSSDTEASPKEPVLNNEFEEKRFELELQNEIDELRKVG